jgi:hypothetical protein
MKVAIGTCEMSRVFVVLPLREVRSIFVPLLLLEIVLRENRNDCVARVQPVRDARRPAGQADALQTNRSFVDLLPDLAVAGMQRT